MKLLFVVLVSPFLTFAQKVDKDTLTLQNGLRFVKGQDVYFGSGSDVATKGYNFIYLNPGILNPNIIKLSAGWSGKKMQINSFKKTGNNKYGEKFYIVLNGGSAIKYLCDITNAIESKEVIVKGYNDGTDKSESKLSVPDELKKWRDLYDNGTITKDEYEAQKKKILGSTN